METYTTTVGDLTVNTTKDTFKERVEKYLKMSHQTLAEMLALRDEDDKAEKPFVQPYTPNQPYTPYIPYTPNVGKWCPMVSGGQCTNPFGDCIDCPYHCGITYCKTNTNCTVDTDNLMSSKCDKKL